ncbi:hypothetical protein DJ021_14830 [Phenylobacterium hankyongense]|uniref:Chemotaxis protein CheW n=1 Tax=Phenylobacterium hankyongense TaxID=1813876 RepID=A0A328B3H0_9CAUL|nr:chemotaxis protein CheW [Phenylobacterium hankyongense]RAK60991.1 hypothetical protein DJ021_14830 [Phenylobacterium hankyongense]
MADPRAAAAAEGDTQTFLTFRSAGDLYALRADQVSEVIRVPAVARLPHGPRSLLGLANLRGQVLPVASLNTLLGRPETVAAALPRAIVLDGAAPVAVAVDEIRGLVAVDPSKIATDQAASAAEAGEVLTGAFDTRGEGVAKILDLRSLLAAGFVPRARPERAVSLVADGRRAADGAADDRQKLVTFEVAGQEYALALGSIREIINAPASVVAMPRSEALVMGVVPYRDSLLPVLSLRGLLGLTQRPAATSDKVVVTIVGGALVGLVVDDIRALISADSSLVEPTPPLLAARTGGESKVKAIYRGDSGRRLVSILDAGQLFREDVMERLGRGAQPVKTEQAGAVDAATIQFLVFRLGGDEFGLPIEVIDEVARAPAKVTRVPRTPKFLEGVINLRGEVLPVIDQRRRFDMPPAADLSARRLVVLRTDRRRAGVIVDGVSEVLSCAATSIEEAPDLAGEATRLVHGVLNLEAQNRMILLLDPVELLTRAERGLLDAFTPETRQSGA